MAALQGVNGLDGILGYANKACLRLLRRVVGQFGRFKCYTDTSSNTDGNQQQFLYHTQQKYIFLMEQLPKEINPLTLETC
jgi:hypothetical protein